MVSTTLKFLVIFLMLFLIFGIFVQHLFSKPQDIKKLICNEGRLLSQVSEEGSVYTAVNGLSCAFEKGILVISGKQNRVATIEY
jgi:hypothetical protein